MNRFDEKFEKLSKNYLIIDKDKVKNFIKEKDKILDFIHEITYLINTYFPDYQKIIELCEDPEFSNLDFVMIYIKGSDFNKDYEMLKKFEKEPLYKSKFSKNINGMLCVELW